MQGNRSTEAAGRVIDLDAQLATRMLEPVPVRLGGHTYKVRTDLSSKEVTEYIAAANASRDVDAFTLLVGKKDASSLNDVLAGMPKQKANSVVEALMRASVALAGYAPAGAFSLSLDVPDADEDRTEGESSAS